MNTSTASIKPLFATCLAAALLAGCAATGPNSPQARPVIYSAATPTAVTQQRQTNETNECIARAQGQGLTPDEKNNEAARRAGVGAATGGVAAAVGALVTSGGIEGVMRSGAAGAAVGGAAGGVSGAMSERASATYRNYVQRCLSDKGFQVIGWN